MERVFRIQGKGKVKDIGLRGLGGYPQVEGLDAEVALIPLGLQAVADLLAEEVTQLAGPRYPRTEEQPGLVRWSQQPGSLYLTATRDCSAWGRAARSAGRSSVPSVAASGTSPVSRPCCPGLLALPLAR